MDCVEFLTAAPSAEKTLIKCKDRGGLRWTNPVIDKVLLASEKCVRNVMGTSGLTEKVTQTVIVRSLSYVLLNNLHKNFICPSHTTSLIKTLIHRYTLTRIKHQTTKLDQKENVRQKLHKLILFNHL